MRDYDWTGTRKRTSYYISYHVWPWQQRPDRIGARSADPDRDGYEPVTALPAPPPPPHRQMYCALGQVALMSRSRRVALNGIVSIGNTVSNIRAARDT